MSDRTTSPAVRVIGFDLDNTLYPATPDIQKRIRGLIYKKVAGELGIKEEKARELFEQFYNSEGNPYSHSGGRTIREIARVYGRKIERDIVQQALEEADILDLIERNPKLVEMLWTLEPRYGIDLITGSARKLALAKLERLGVEPDVFDYMLTTEENGSKTTGEAYRQWIKMRKFPPKDLVYVGDNKVQDVEVPKKLGIRTCFLGRSNPGADFHIQDILELEKMLGDSLTPSVY